MKYPEIRELDFNPVMLYPEGNIIIDARIILEESETEKTRESLGKDKIVCKAFLSRQHSGFRCIGQAWEAGWNVFHNLLDNGFNGKLYPINVKAKTIQGMPAFSNVNEIIDPIDLAVILVLRLKLCRLLRSAVRRGLRLSL
jgi:hypothetical protein